VPNADGLRWVEATLQAWVRSAAKYRSEAEPEHAGQLMPSAFLLTAPYFVVNCVFSLL